MLCRRPSTRCRTWPPEQTGRTGLPIDLRSDLYAAGVTFTSCSAAVDRSKPRRLQNGCIATWRVRQRPYRRQSPNSSGDRRQAFGQRPRGSLPNGPRPWKPICSVVSGSSRKADGSPFTRSVLQDTARELNVPAELYGREAARDQLRASFDRVARGATEFVLVSGYSGIGKSALVDDLHRSLLAKPVRWARGKFDQYKARHSVRHARRSAAAVLRQILSGSDGELNHFRHALRDAVGPKWRADRQSCARARAFAGDRSPRSRRSRSKRPSIAFQLLVQRVLSVFARANTRSCCSWTICNGPIARRSICCATS